MKDHPLLDFAQRYTAAWCSQDAASVAAFFSTDGSLSVNDNPPAVGRPAISASPWTSFSRAMTAPSTIGH